MKKYFIKCFVNIYKPLKNEIFAIKSQSLLFILIKMESTCFKQMLPLEYTDPVTQIKESNHQNSLNPLVQMFTKSNKENFVVSKLDSRIQNTFSVIKRFQVELANLIYTQKSLLQFIQAFLKCIKKIGDGESNQDKASVQKIFCPLIIQGIKSEQKFFGDVLKQFQEIKKGQQINSANKSRIYHEIANIKKEIKEKSNIKQNKFGLRVQKTYEYNYLSDEQMDEVVKLQHVGAQIQKLGQTIKFKLDSVRKQTEAITFLLGNTFNKYAESVSNLKYDLNIEEVMMMADMARQACNDYKNGVYLLVVYFIRSCGWLQKHSFKIHQIQEKLNVAISQISKKYPLGEILSFRDQKYKKQLEEQQLTKQKFQTKPQILYPNQKQQQIQEIIKSYALIAKKNKPFFESMVKTTCLENCLSFRVGLKYDSDSPNPKALTQIIEQILFKNDKMLQKMQQTTTIANSIDQQFNQEDKNYKKKIQQKLKDQQIVLFAISDMIRGECIFSSIKDIVITVSKIKNYIADHPHSYKLIEVESRFKNETPMSGVTLIIALKNEIIAELQLIYQTNAAAYIFALKIHYFSQPNFFSKIRVIDNQHKKFKAQFTKMIDQSVMLAEAHNSNSPINELTQNIKKHASEIREYFGLKQKTKSKNFRQLLERELFLSSSQIGEELWANEELQDLILPIFCIKIGEWGLQLGDKINTVILKQNHSPIFKSTLIYFLYRHIDTEQHFQSIKQFQNKRKRQIFQHQQQNNQKWKEQNIQFQEYIQNIFEIQRVEKYHNSNARLFYQFKNLSAIINCMFKGNTFIIIHKYQYQINRIFGENSEQTILSLMNFAKVCYLRKQFSFFQSLAKWSIDLTQKLYEKDSQKKYQYIAIIQLLMAQNYLHKNQIKQAEKSLDKILDILKCFKKEDYKIDIERDLMLAECKIKQGCIQGYQNSYQRVLNKVKTKGIPFRGRTVADTEWRIAQERWQIAQSVDVDSEREILEKEILEKHYQRAMVLFSAQNNVEQCVIASKTIPWREFKKKKLAAPSLGENKLTFILDLGKKNIGVGGCEVLKECNISNLKQLFLNDNQIRNQGCKYLMNANWPNLCQLNLNFNSIKSQGCQYLSNAQWPNINKLDLGNNSIGDRGCDYLRRASWPNLSQLKLDNNSIGTQGCRYLWNESNWTKLSLLTLQYNDFNAQDGQLLKNKHNWLSSISIKI